MSPQHSAAVEEAVSHVAYALSDFSYLVQPVPFGSALERYIVSARRNVFDQVGKVEESSAGQELIERAYAAAARGQFVTLFASSPSALLQMVPAMYKLSSAQLPAVIHVVAREHSDLMAVRQTGFVILNSLNATETEDMALLAHVASLRANVPFLHVYDGEMAHNDLEQQVAASSSKFHNALVDYEYLANLIGLKNASEAPEFRQIVLNKSGVVDNADDAELYFQVSPECIAKYNAVPEVVEDVIKQVFAKKGYQLFEYYGHPEAEQVLVVMGTASSVVKDAVESLYTNWKAKVGVISVRLFRPWSTKTFLSVVPATATKFAVLDRMDDATNVGEPLFMDVLGSFQSEEWQNKPVPSVIGGKYAFNVSESVFDVVTARTLVEELAADKLQNGFVVASPAAEEEFSAKKTTTTQLVSSYVSSKDGFEAPYVKMLLQLFEKRAVIANLVRSETVWKSQDKTAGASVSLENGEFGFGVHLGILAKRQELKDKVKSLVSGDHAKSIVSQRLLECFVQWSEKQPKHDELANEITILLENEQHHGGVLGDIYALKQYFAPLSQWILGSEEFSRDVGASGVHQVLASGENVNLLILDTEPMNAVSKSNRKRDLGLYAMQYGNAYVASVALYDSYSQVLRALNEADAFDGPSIVLAYAPSSSNMEQETKEAVTSGYWPLYRYNPLLEDVEGEKAFSLESPSIKKDLLTFLQRNNQLSLFAKQALTTPTAASVSEKYEQIGQQALKTSFEALLNGFGGQQQEPWQVDTKLWLLVGSDNGHADEFASKLEEDALNFGLKNVEKMDMNEMTIDQLLDEANDENAYVVFVCSTAGQGEFPSNGKEFWGELSGFSSTLPLQYAVFGMGDSLYWPREDEKHYFCKAPTDLDAKLSELGAKRVVDLGKGDDQDEDGPMTQFELWKPQLWEQIGIPADVVSLHQGTKKKQRTNEEIKQQSNYLRGTLVEGLEDRTTKALAADDTQLTKFHGIYQQDDRDLREQMRLEKKEKAFCFMIRVRVPGGVSTAQQYLMIDELADSHANGNIKLSTRQAYQLQGILKWNLKPIVHGINRVLMDSLAACGDVNRNVMATVNPSCSVETHQEILDIAREISAHLTPKTSAYHEIWLDKKMVAGGEVKAFEPFYGEAYLPRKFKIAMAIPPANDVDVYANCLGFIAILEKDKLVGFNVTVGGGMGMTHNNQKTYPRLADVMAFCTPDQCKDVAEKVMVLQRDFGDRVNRKHARFKYTVEDHGLEWIRAETEKRLGYKLQEPRKFKFHSNGDRFGWIKNSHGKYHYGMYVEGGRIKDTKESGIRSGLRELAKTFPHVEFHLTGNQNLSLGNISEEDIPQIKALMEKYKFGNDNYSGMRLNSIACAALPMCGLAFAEAERYLPSLITKIEDMLEANGLRDDAIVIRMTGCPNGCGRPYLGEIGFVGRSPGIYNMYLGAGFAGDRLNKLYKEAVDEAQILEELEPIIKDYAENRDQGEKFGDYVTRAGYVKACRAAPLIENRAPGEDFHA
ncbi:Sulfite reductase (NADPH) hemoprotein, beta-component [Phytophthora palmivora]|uniref:assimilatory sulfite reductase (NADPH) n=1 Tax=Phytophthora palmivora TaxID=4796 RepID=A0A2P4X0B9_9STRA|nr:Sulfite reductase (NADPH) hemoprotein, beta-component [Phytophthora palmivora]